MNPTDNILSRTISDLEDRFGRVFGLRAFPGERFSISPSASYVSDYQGVTKVMVYVYRWDDSQGRWLAFSKDTPSECLRTFVRVSDSTLEPLSA